MFTTVTLCVLPTALRALDVSSFLSMMERTTLFDLDSEQRIVAFYLVVLVFLVSSALILSKLEARDCFDSYDSFRLSSIPFYTPTTVTDTNLPASIPISCTQSRGIDSGARDRPLKGILRKHSRFNSSSTPALKSCLRPPTYSSSSTTPAIKSCLRQSTYSSSSTTPAIKSIQHEQEHGYFHQFA